MLLDALFFLIMVAVTSLAAQRKLAGLVVGVGSLIAYKPLMLLASRNIWASLIAGIVLAAALGFGGRLLAPMLRLKTLPATLLGALGGMLLSLLVVVGFSVSLPIRRDLNNQIIYPPRVTSGALAKGIASSKILALGRNVLLYPLFDPGIFPESERPILSGMHNFFVSGEPWNQSQ